MRVPGWVSVQKEENAEGGLLGQYPGIDRGKGSGDREDFEACINPLQEGEFKSVTIDTGYGKKARIKDTKDGLKIELEEKKKDEALA